MSDVFHTPWRAEAQLVLSGSYSIEALHQSDQETNRSSVQSIDRPVVGGWEMGDGVGWDEGWGPREDSAEILFQSFLWKAILSSIGHQQGCPLFDVVHPVFPVPTAASPKRNISW